MADFPKQMETKPKRLTFSVNCELAEGQDIRDVPGLVDWLMDGGAWKTVPVGENADVCVHITVDFK